MSYKVSNEWGFLRRYCRSGNINAQRAVNGLPALGFMIFSIHAAVLLLGHTSRFDSVVTSKPWNNSKVLPSVAVFLCVSTAVAAGRLYSANAANWQSIPTGWAWWIILILSLIANVWVVEVTKKIARHTFEKDQKFLKLLFQTRLGMWSPK